MRWIPNALTILRVLLIPVFVWLIFVSEVQNHVAWALLVFAVCAVTDFLDGWLARKWKVISDFGKIADPLADKLVVLSALAALTWLEPYRLFLPIFIAIALREVVITVLREVYKKRGIILPADTLGKWKTFLQMTGIILAFALWAWLPAVPRYCVTAANIWFGLVALLTLYSGLNYFKPPQQPVLKEEK
ncbi:MAG: CDP-diacylglycerol--glycerol-3-phosphate 3-phosphatidyltransferase [Candidatus Syntrophosphaera sp.]|nr:CDP-diacylglycerol--glycerol-3-phosphate 3-phosphatidyltransferase [Candidatus Syntrophosphaera sp.]